MRKILIGLVLASLVLAVPALAVDNNGFETDYCYAKSGGDMHMLSQATGNKVGQLSGMAGESHCFSNSPVCGAYTPAGARLFTAERYRMWTNRRDEILLREYNAAGTEIRRSYLSRWCLNGLGGPLNVGGKDIVIGTIRYNPVNDTLIISINPGNKASGYRPSKAYEIALPDWDAPPPWIGGGCYLVNVYTLLNQYKNRTNIAINPNDGMMYATGYNYGSYGSGLRAGIGETPTNPADPNFGVNTLILDGTMYRNHCGDNQWYQPAALTYQDLTNGFAQLLNSHESTWTEYQPYAWSWIHPGVCVGNPSKTFPMPIIARIGTPGADIAPRCHRRRGVRANTDLLTGEAFIVGNGTRNGNRGGVLQIKNTRPHTGSLILGGDASGYGDAASPGGPPPPLAVDVDILPADDPNLLTVNMEGKGRLPIAILGSEEVDVTTIDLSSLNMAGVGLPVRTPVIEDTNEDGHLDIVMHFSRRDVIANLELELLDCDGSVVEVTIDGAMPCGLAVTGSDDLVLECRED